jgi:hypothetical protein
MRNIAHRRSHLNFAAALGLGDRAHEAAECPRADALGTPRIIAGDWIEMAADALLRQLTSRVEAARKSILLHDPEERPPRYCPTFSAICVTIATGWCMWCREWRSRLRPLPRKVKNVNKPNN